MGQKAILVVDDNKIMRDLLRGFLETEDYSVYLCEDGRCALYFLQLSSQIAPTLISFCFSISRKMAYP